MDRVWAPWRMEYILGGKAMGCFLCESSKIGIAEEPLVLHLTPHSMVIMNRYPYTSGHLLVTPRRHVSGLHELSSQEMLDLHETLRKTVGLVQEWATPDGINVGMNLGKAAGAGLEEHIHYHIVPRFHGDNNAMNVFGEVRIIPESLIETYRRLLPQFEKLQ